MQQNELVLPVVHYLKKADFKGQRAEGIGGIGLLIRVNLSSNHLR